MEPFWIVVSEERGTPGHFYRHTSLESAKRHAERLCRDYGGAFFVMEAISLSKTVDVVTTKIDDIPL